MSISVLTIVKNRPNHLSQLIEALKRSVLPPDELVIVDMGSDPPVVRPDANFPITVVPLLLGGLPLAAARNAAARAAMSEHLLFLDVDCIAMRDLIGDMERHLSTKDALICAEAFYLGIADARASWSEEALKRCAQPHPVRSFPLSGAREEPNAGLFWSLVFGIRRDRFSELDGFDEAFTGYGAEDTDFGFRARRAGVPLIFMGGPGVFHQQHDVFDPPLQHVEDIVRNARLFHQRWGVWPMEGWLNAFARAGLVAWSGDLLTLLRLPTAQEVGGARRSSAF